MLQSHLAKHFKILFRTIFPNCRPTFSPLLVKKPATIDASPTKYAITKDALYVTHLKNCACGGAFTLRPPTDAVLMTLDGPIDVKHQAKRCTRKNCRSFYGYNYSIQKHTGQKFNSVGLSDVTCLFIIVSTVFVSSF